MDRGLGKNISPERNDGGRITRGQIADEKKRKADEETEKRNQKRRAELFAPHKNVGRNDIFVDNRLGKIKIEDAVGVVKEENIEEPHASGSHHSVITSKDMEEQTTGEQDEQLEEDTVFPFQDDGKSQQETVDIKIEVKDHVTDEMIEDASNEVMDTTAYSDTRTQSSNPSQINSELTLFIHLQRIDELITQIQEESGTICPQSDEQRKILDNQGQKLDKVRRELQQLNEKMTKYEALGSVGSQNVTVEEPHNEELPPGTAENLKDGQLEKEPWMDNVQEPIDEVPMMSLQTAENLVTERLEDVFGNVFAHLNLYSVLNCRNVCKKWKNFVDSFLENHPSRRPFSKEVHQAQLKRGKLTSVGQDKNIMELENKYVFSDAESIEEFLKIWETRETNPFLGRSVVFQIDEESKNAKRFKNGVWSKFLEVENKRSADGGFLNVIGLNEEFCCKLNQFTQIYWNSVLKLLSCFGKHIWYVKIAQYELGLTPLLLYKIVQECLPHLTNLKNLVVAGESQSFLAFPPHLYRSPRRFQLAMRGSSNFPNRVYDLEPSFERLSRKRMQELAEYMRKCPTLPKLGILKSFEFLINDGITRDIQDAIVVKCVQEKNQLLRFATSVFSAESVQLLPRNGLKEITVIENHLNIYYHLERSLRYNHPGTFEDMNQLKGTQLEKISLKDKQLNIPKILNLLQDFPTVCYLQLNGNVKLGLNEGITEQNEGITERNEVVQSLVLKHKIDSKIYLEGSDNFPEEWEWIDFYDGLMSFFPKLQFLNIIEVLPFKWENDDDEEESDDDEDGGKGSNKFKCSLDQRAIQINNSDIWTKFHSLEFIKLEVMNWDGEKKEGKTWFRNYPH